MLNDWTVSLGLDRAKEIMGGLIEPNKGEKKNGWTTEKLTIYMAERKVAFVDKIFPKKQKPNRTRSRMRWLRR